MFTKQFVLILLLNCPGELHPSGHLSSLLTFKDEKIMMLREVKGLSGRTQPRFKVISVQVQSGFHGKNLYLQDSIPNQLSI